MDLFKTFPGGEVFKFVINKIFASPFRSLSLVIIIMITFYR